MYKRIGPVLARQDIEEAKANVQKRIEFIMGESCVSFCLLMSWSDRVDKLIESLASKRDGLQNEVSLFYLTYQVLKLQQPWVTIMFELSRFAPHAT